MSKEVESAENQGRAMDIAYGKFLERNRVYKDLWKQDEMDGLIAHVKHKTLRIANTEDPASRLDDAIDLINYSVFILRELTGDDWENESADQ